MNARLGRFVFVALLAGAFAPVAPAQSNSSSSAPVDSDQVIVQSFSPKIFGADELRVAAGQLFGETLMVSTSSSGNDGQTHSGFATVPHFVVLGNLLIIRDTRDNAPAIVQTLRELEAVEAKRQKEVQDISDAAARPGEQDEPGGPVSSLELRPRHVSYDTLFTALQPFQRGTTSVIGIPNSNLIVLRDTAKRLAELNEFAERIDRPRPQVLIHVTLAQASRSTSPKDTGLAPELVRNLQAMLPGQNFELMSRGMLRCSMQSGQECSLEMKLSQGGSWKLLFLPEAYDPDSGLLSFRDCRFHLEMPGRQQSPDVLAFETSLTVAAGEYVALGAVGEQPVFVVVRTEPLQQAH
jgi:hypothetical protein